MLLPQIDVAYIARSMLYVLNNCLCVLFETSETHWAAWWMKEYVVFESWTKLTIIPHHKFIARVWYYHTGKSHLWSLPSFT
jgi:hypothetical protein